jgi:hypothetical protein
MCVFGRTAASALCWSGVGQRLWALLGTGDSIEDVRRSLLLAGSDVIVTGASLVSAVDDLVVVDVVVAARVRHVIRRRAAFRKPPLLLLTWRRSITGVVLGYNRDLLLLLLVLLALYVLEKARWEEDSISRCRVHFSSCAYSIGKQSMRRLCCFSNAPKPVEVMAY